MWFLLMLISCQDDPWIQPGCGDGVLDPTEACDQGSANSDTAPDACRTDCTLPSCGDAVVDAGEECDDGGTWGADGCSPTCASEPGPFETEPNDDLTLAQAWAGGPITGALPEGDQDCYSLFLAGCTGMAAQLSGDCTWPAQLSLLDPQGALVATGTPGADGCAVLDPSQAPGARWVAEGTWTLCVSGFLGSPVPSYTLDLSQVGYEDAGWTVKSSDDPDGDSLPDDCDADRDGDGVLNTEDNCPTVPNGPVAGALTPDGDGFLHTWLAAGPYTGLGAADQCVPSEDNLVAEDDATAEPTLGGAAGERTWTFLYGDVGRVSFLDGFAWVAPPREVYTALYVYNPVTRAVTLGLGPDDGARVWLDGSPILEVTSCQGTVVDAFTADLELTGGWHRLLVKVRDWGGDWGLYARFLSGGVPLTDLELSIDPSGAPLAPQSDNDGDGVGDVCDDTP